MGEETERQVVIKRKLRTRQCQTRLGSVTVLLLLVLRDCVPVELKVPVEPTCRREGEINVWTRPDLTDIDPTTVPIVVLQRVVIYHVNYWTDHIGLQILTLQQSATV